MANKKHRIVILIGFALVSICWFISAPCLRAQTVSGTILGTIQDQQGGVIAKADVSARSLDTGAVRKTTAELNGNYRIYSVLRSAAMALRFRSPGDARPTMPSGSTG
jgi:hypothetical protein